MNEQIKIFENPQFGKIRTAGTSDEPLFCLADVCRVLELRTDAVKTRLKNAPISIGVIDSMGREQTAMFINEQNLYRVIMRSDKPQAEPFQDWVCGEVLPSIRKHGAYMTDEIIERTLTDPDYLIRLATELKNEKQKRLLAEQTVEKQTKQLTEQQPKVDFYNAVTQSKNTVTMECAAKLIKEKPFNIPKFGRNKLFAIMRETGVFFGKGRDVRPYQKHIDSGCFELAEYTYRQCGANMVGVQIMVTQKGLDFIIKTVVEYFREQREAEQQNRPVQLHFNI